MDFDDQAIKAKINRMQKHYINPTSSTSFTFPSSLPPLNTHTHTSITPRPLSKLSTVGSLAKACLVFLNCKHEMGRGARGKHSQNRGKNGLGWNHAFQDTKSNLEIFFWPRVKRMILLWDESLDDALHDRKEKSGRDEWGERRCVRHTNTNKQQESHYNGNGSWFSLCPLFPQRTVFFLDLTFLIW